MNDYELVYVPSVGNPRAGMCSISVSEGKVRIFPGVLEKLGNPKRIVICRGVRSNEGKVVIRKAEDTPGALLIDYDRKKICFYSKEILDPFKDLIRQYAQMEFTPGIFFMIKGVPIAEDAIEFDFRYVTYRIMNVSEKAANALISYRKKTTGKSDSQNILEPKIIPAYSAASGFNMPKMTGRMI